MAVKNINVNKDGLVYLSDFKDWIDIDRVEYYKFKFKKDKTIEVKFYDKKKKLIRPYER